MTRKPLICPLKLNAAYVVNLVFAEADGSIINPQKVGVSFSTVMSKTSITRRTFHELRHTFASISISKGLSIKTVSKILGHAKINITLDTYGHLLPGDAEAVIDAVAAYYEGWF